LAVVGSVGNPGVVCGKEPAGGLTSAELFFIIVMVVVRVLGGIVDGFPRWSEDGRYEDHASEDN